MTTIRPVILFQTVSRKMMRTMMPMPMMNGHHERWKGSMSNSSGTFEKAQSGLKVWARAKRLTLSPGSRYGNDIERTLLHRLLSVLLTCYPLFKQL
jgi:hypothetical protein